MFRGILLLFCVLIEAQSSPAPKFTQCKKDDSVCLSKSANTIYKLTVKGVPELGIEVLDPMYQDNIEGNLAVIKYKLYNSTINGFGSCNVVYTKLEYEKSTLSIDMDCPHVVMHGLYETSGQILIMPIEGKGDFKIDCKDYHIHIDIDVKFSQGKDGKIYLSFKSYRVNGELQGGMIALSNLFNGKQKELAKTVLRFVNENWKDVSKELQGPVFNANIKKLIKNFNKYFRTIPLEQLIEL